MKMVHWMGACVAPLVLAACGGGDGTLGSALPPPAAATAEGAYAGALSGATSSNAFDMIVLDGGEYWVPYGTLSNNVLYVAGFIQGTGTSNAGTFSSSNGRDFGVSPVGSDTVSATYVAGTSAQGTVSSAFGTVNFSGTVAGIAPYVYNTPASLSSIVGTWSMNSLLGNVVTVNVSGAGSFSSNEAGCISTGSVLPRPSGKNVFDVVVTAGASPCLTPGLAGHGIAVYSPIANSTVHQLIVGVVSNDRASGSAYVGAR